MGGQYKSLGADIIKISRITYTKIKIYIFNVHFLNILFGWIRKNSYLCNRKE